MIFVSLAIDMARANTASHRLQAAVDSAAMAGARFKLLTEAERRDVVKSYFKANWDQPPDSPLPQPTLIISINLNDKELKVAANAKLNALFFNLPGLFPFDLHREAVVKMDRVRLIQ